MQNDAKKNVAILFGGKSPEHEISIITGIQVLNNIDKEKFNPIPIYIAKDGTWYYSPAFDQIEVFRDLDDIPVSAAEVYLIPEPNTTQIIGKKSGFFGLRLKIPVDVIFPCFHGALGENGAFQGLFEISEIPYVGSEVLGSSVCMDKVLTKNVLQANNIKTAPYKLFNRTQIRENLDETVLNIEKDFHYPIFVKPAVGGSSVGITKATNKESLKNGLELASAFDLKVIVEQGIENTKEINISVMGNLGEEFKVSVCEEVYHSGDFLTYDDKYKGNDGKSSGMASTKRQIPANLSNELTSLVQEVAKKAFEALNCFGLARIDFLVKEETKEVFIIEVNTIPGSMAFYLWEGSGMSFKEMVSNLIELAFNRQKERSKNVMTFSTNVLKDFKSSLKAPKLGK